VEQATGAEPQRRGLPPRIRLVLAGALGLPIAVAVAAALEAGLQAGGSHGGVPGVYFAAVAGLTPVLALGLLVQLLTALTGRTRHLMSEVQRFDEEMSVEEPQFDEGSHRDRMVAWASARLFVHAVVPFGAGVITQVLVCEIVAVTCLLTGSESRFLALALGCEVVALFVYLLLFGRILGRLTRPPRRPA
jgi:hypothetical protein